VKVKVGRYTGDGTNPRVFTGLGLAPDVVFIKPANTQHLLIGFRGVTPYFFGAAGSVSGAITCDADGFTLSGHGGVNGAGIVYAYLAIEAPGGDAKVDTYEGNNTADREIDGLGFRPGFVLVRRHSTASGTVAWWRCTSMSAGMSCSSFFGETANRIKSFTSDGFTLSAHEHVNLSGAYSYLAIADIDGCAESGEYTGNAQDNRNLDVVGWRPDSLQVKRAELSGAGVWRTKDHVGDVSGSLHNDAEAANLIQELRDLGFQVGTDDRVNRNTSRYVWYALREGDSAVPDIEELDSSDSAAASETAHASEYTAPEIVQASDAGALDKEWVGAWGYWRPQPGVRLPWGPLPGVQAFITSSDSAAATDAARLAEEQIAAGDSGVLTDAIAEAPPVEHLGLEPVAAEDVAALWYEIEVSETEVHGEDEVAIEIQPVGDSDAGALTDTAEVPAGIYDGHEAGLAADAWVRLRAETATADAAAALEAAQRVIILSRHILECTIESSVEALADAFDLTLVESDPSDPLAPRAQAWRSVGEGDLVQVRIGLADVGMDDYGTFRVDGAAARATESELVTELHGRDRAALLVDERRDPRSYRLSAYRELDATTWTRPTCRAIAGRLAALVGLGLVWDAPDYRLKEFTLRADESIAAALGRLLEPLQVSRRWRSDAWVDGDSLVVRRRGNGPVLGALECSLGLVRSIVRERQPAVAQVRVWGGTETVLAGYEDEESGEAGDSQVQIEDDGSGRRVVRTYTRRADGLWALSQEESEELVFEDVFEPPRWLDEHRFASVWLGRLLVESRTIIRSDLHTDSPKTERRVVRFDHDDAHRLALREETLYEWRAEEWQEREKTLVRYEQVTPTDVRTTTTEWRVVAGQLRVRRGFPRRVEQPGVLQSALRTDSPPDYAWDQQEDGSEPERRRRIERTIQYRGTVKGIEGGIPVEASLPHLMSHAACQQIAEDLASESGKWLYQFEVFWPRPLPYRKGDRVALTHLPADMPDMVAVITRVRTQFSAEQAAWTHDITLEAWSDE